MKKGAMYSITGLNEGDLLTGENENNGPNDLTLKAKSKVVLMRNIEGGCAIDNLIDNAKPILNMLVGSGLCFEQVCKLCNKNVVVKFVRIQ